MGYLFLVRYNNAGAACAQSAGLNVCSIRPVYLTAAYAQTGEMGKAKVARDELLKLQPGFTIDRYRKIRHA